MTATATTVTTPGADGGAPGPLLHPFARPAAVAAGFTTMVRGEGALVFDRQGRRYLDAMASLWHCNVGHARPEVAEAVARQLGELETYHCFERFSNPRGARPGRREPGLPDQRWVRGRRHCAQAQPAGARPAR